MARSPRREREEDGEDEEEEQQRESSDAQSHGGKGKARSAKRPKKAVDEPEAEDDSSDEDEDRGNDSDAMERRDRRVAKLMGNDGDDSDGGYDAKAAAAASNNGKESDAGVILEIRAQHFMCHENLSITLNKRVNFICGSNGSGKSAILAALQICLGARAKLTHRAKRLDDLIRHGYKGDAVLEVKVVNSDDGFEYKKYGDSITVRRTIRRGSAAGKFQLLDHHGNEVTKDRKELDRMLDALNIQVENPCAVLDQENAKKFLQGSDRDKYDFFMKATDLDRIERDSNTTRKEVEDMRSKLAAHEEKLIGHKETVNELHRQVKAFEELAQIEGEIKRLKQRAVWWGLEAAEEKEHGAKTRVEEREKRLRTLATKVKEGQGSADAVREELAQLKTDMTAKMEATQQSKAATLAATKKLAVARQPINELKAQEDGAKSELRNKQQEKRKLEQRLEGMRKEAVKRAEGREQREVAQQLQASEAALARATERALALETELQTLEAAGGVKPLEEAAADATGQAENVRRDLRDEKQRLSSLAVSKGDPVAMLGQQNMPRFVKAVQQAQAHGRFKAEVFGPIGACIKVKEQYRKFQPMAEHQVRNYSTTFVVQNADDKVALQSMMRAETWQHNQYPPIIIQPPHAQRYPVPVMPEGYVTMMDCLTIKSDTIFNVLCDQAKLEFKACFETEGETRQKLIGDQRQGQLRLPYNIKEGYWLSDNGRNCSMLSVKKGNMMARTNVGNPRYSILTVDGAGTEEQQRRLQEQVAELERQMREAQTAQDKATAECRKAQQHQSQMNEELHQVQNAARRESQKSEQLRRKLQDLQSSGNAIDTTGLEAEIEACVEDNRLLQESIKQFAEQAAAASADLAPLQADVNAAKSRQAELDKEMDLLGERFQALTDERRKAEQLVVRALDLKKEDEHKLADAQAELQRAEENIKVERERVEKYMHTTEKEWDGSRIRADDTLEVLKRKLEAKMRVLERSKKEKNLDQKSKLEVMEQYERARKIFKEKREDCEKLHDTANLCEKENLRRRTVWLRFRRYIRKRTSNLFDEYMQRRGSSGEVKFDEATRELHLTVQKVNTDDSTQTDNVRQLSGGERSHTTLSLLLALGSCHECPFRVMDEFDVFMDSVARGVAIKLLLEFADQNQTRQFIFITPQNVSNVAVGPHVRVVRMQEARPMGQGAIDEHFRRSS